MSAPVRAAVTRLLEVPSLYGLLQRSIAPESRKRIFVDEYLRASPGDRVLDIGCGPGYLVRYLPPVEYLGFDPNPDYIASARSNFGEQGEFIVGGIDDVELAGRAPFDIVVSKGVLHHLDDDQVIAVADLAKSVLGPHGRLVCLEPCFVPNQSRVSRFLVSHDRGEHVRRAEDYQALLARHLPSVAAVHRTDLLTVPYTHVILTASS